MTKDMIYKRILNIEGYIRNSQLENALDEIDMIKQDMQREIKRSKSEERPDVIDRTILHIVDHDHTGTGHSKRSDSVHLYEDRILYHNPHILAATKYNMPILTPKPLSGKTLESIRDILTRDYQSPATKSFKCMNAQRIRNGIKGMGARNAEFRTIYQFRNGPALKAIYYQWAIELTGAEVCYTHTGIVNGKKVFNNLVYFPGEDFDVYVCPIMSTGDHTPGYFLNSDY